MLIFKFFKKIIFFIIKEIFSALILLGIIIGIIVSLSIGISKTIEKKPSVSMDTYIVIELPNGLKESKNFNLNLFGKEKDLTFFEFINAIKYAKNDENISGIILKLDYLDLSFSQIEEISKELKYFKESGKRIYAYGEYVSKNAYLLGTVAENIQMNPSASTDLVLDGFDIKIPYYKNLANNFGVEFQVIHIGDFKTFGENYVKDTISNEFKEQYQNLLSSKLNYFVNEISKNRKLDTNTFRKNYLEGKYIFMNSSEALKNKFIDKKNSYEEYLNSNEIKETISISQYYNTVSTMPYDDKIAIINLEGDISNSNTTTDAITPTRAFELLNKAEEDESVKGIVVRINSPGGSALASEIINQKIQDVKKTKPVYISISEVAASGGYYMAVAGDKIFANENSITGSIGVVSMYFNLDSLYKKLGLNYESISLGKTPVSFGINKKIPEEEISILRGSMTNIYEEFKLRVAQGRKIDLLKVEELAQGRVYNGIRAKELKLIDEIGGLTVTIESLASHLKLSNYEVVLFNNNNDKFKEYLNFSNYLKGNSIYKEFNEIKEKTEILNELNGKPSVFLPLEIKKN
ncbi:MAG: signal peptide peptidase SppA [Fusobacteriaceae bacterium]|nr:signal peptide peptidase SppA [Fusobacteriaceae bacterium]